MTDERFSATLELMSGQHQQGFSHKKTRLIIAGMLIVFGISWYVFAARDKYPVYPSSHSPTSTLPPILTYTFSPSSVRRSSNTTIPLLEWQTYTDAKLRATFEYPTTWKLINTKSDPSQTGVGSDYNLAFEDTTILHHAVSIYISSINNPGNLSLADFYRKYSPGGAERYATIAFQETINPHGVRFEKIVQPYVSPDYNDTRETVHGSRIYEITKTIAVPLSTGMPAGSDYHQNPKFQEAVAGYNHLIDSFTFTDEGQTEQNRH